MESDQRRRNRRALSHSDGSDLCDLILAKLGDVLTHAGRQAPYGPLAEEIYAARTISLRVVQMPFGRAICAQSVVWKRHVHLDLHLAGKTFTR
jgi:hypothetical protein